MDVVKPTPAAQASGSHGGAAYAETDGEADRGDASGAAGEGSGEAADEVAGRAIGSGGGDAGAPRDASAGSGSTGPGSADTGSAGTGSAGTGAAGKVAARRQADWVLEALVVLSWLAGAIGASAMLTVYHEVALGASGAIGLFVALGAWLWRRRHVRARGATVAFAAGALLALACTDGALVLPLMLVALLLVVLDFSIRAGLLLVATVCMVQALAMLLLYRQDPANVGTQSLGIGLLLFFGLAYAVVVKRARRAQADREAAVAALDAANARLAEANRQLRRSLATERDLVLAQERARSARELHDGLGHRLTVVSMSLDFAERMRARDPDRAWAEVSAAREMTSDAMTHMRMWVRALHPAELGELTDVAAFEAIAESFRGTGLDVRIERTGPDRPLPAEVSLLCHRVVQEGLTNALRHARATGVLITLDLESTRLRISLSDNGIGATEVVEGFGLRSLRERAEALSGRVDLVRGDDGGMCLTVEVPLAAEPARAREGTGTRSDLGSASAGETEYGSNPSWSR